MSSTDLLSANFFLSQALERMKSTDGIELPHAWKGKLEDLAAKSREAMVNICFFEYLLNAFPEWLCVCVRLSACLCAALHEFKASFPFMK